MNTVNKVGRSDGLLSDSFVSHNASFLRHKSKNRPIIDVASYNLVCIKLYFRDQQSIFEEMEYKNMTSVTVLNNKVLKTTKCFCCLKMCFRPGRNI